MKINENNLEIKDNKTKNISKISKAIWNKHYHECVDGNFNWIMKFLNEEQQQECSLIQYPLRHCMFTYYFVQGLTFENQTLCIDLDSVYANSLYVGFSRVIQLDQIVEIQSKNFINMLYTQYKNDLYLYKIPKPTMEIIEHMQKVYQDKFYKFNDDHLNFKEVSVIQFEKCGNSLQFVKTQKSNSLKRKSTTNPVAKKQKKEKTELGNLLWTQYLDKS